MAYPVKKKKGNPQRAVKEDIEAAQQLAFRFLSYRSRSVEEVRGKLAGSGFSPAVIKQVLARITELGYLNDHDFAFTYGRSCMEHKLWGPTRIKDALLKKGVASGIISSVLEELSREHDLSSLARRALESRFPPAELGRPLQPHTRKKAIGLLLRKGFSWNIIAAVINPGYDTFM